MRAIFTLTIRWNYRVRKIDTAGIITTIAGIGVDGYGCNNCRADTTAISRFAGEIIVDKTGNLLFLDSFRIRKIDTAGIITTIVGDGIEGDYGDGGTATAAQTGGGDCYRFYRQYIHR